MKKQMKIQELRPNPDNPRVIKDEKFKKLVKSIKGFPKMLELRPVVVDEDMIILGGNMRYRACIEAGLKEVWVEVAEGLTEEQKKEFIIKDNASFGEWEWDMLGNEWNTKELDDWGIDVWQNVDDVNDLSDEKYTKSITIPTYETKNEKPEVEDLIDTRKADELIEKIKEADLSQDELMFLSHAALRHTVFDYSKIADFYTHSSKEVQELMEQSALVIIDFDKAIENGFVTLTDYLMEIQKDDE